jgi:hypothetical protein
MKLCSWQRFYFKSSCQQKLSLNLSNLKFKFCIRPQMKKMKVVDLEMFWNFVVDIFFIWFCLWSQTNNIHSVMYNISRIKTEYKQDNCKTAPLLGFNSAFDPLFLTLQVCPSFSKLKLTSAPFLSSVS